MLSRWVIEKLEALKAEQILLVQDSLRLLPESDGAVHRFANESGFTVIIASTNLVFRELFEKAAVSKETKKLLLIDRAPARRKTHASLTKAPPPFYPDLYSKTTETARIDISLRQFLIETTGDPNWPQDVNDPRFARLITNSLDAVFKAYKSLRIADPSRFTDHDFKTIVAYSALGVPDAAFKLPEAKTYWRIALIGYPALEELKSLAPEVAHSISNEVRSAPAPFCWFADSPPELIVRAFYLSTILSQHLDHWKLLLSNIDPDLKAYSEMGSALIAKAAPELVSIDFQRAHRDLLDVEDSLSKDNLNLILIDQMKVNENGRFAEIIEKESYSILIRSLALLVGLDSLLSDAPPLASHKKLAQLLFADTDDRKTPFIEQRPSSVWENLKEAYRLVRSILDIKKALDVAVKNLTVKPTSDLNFEWFRALWNDRKLNRLEYYLSALERLVFSVEFLPRSESDLPSYFLAAESRIKDRVQLLRNEIDKTIGILNSHYQNFIALNYKSWVASDNPEVRLTSQFLRRCLKPNWDPKTEKAVVFVFDGMRYDIWDELVRPIFEDRMEVIADYPATSLLPSETHISRKAIFSGTFPDSFNTKRAENDLLKDAMQRVFGFEVDVKVVAPEGMGTGETVRYRADNIDFYIFELCDKELHKIPMKSLPDGRIVPGRPLAFIYQQHIKDIIDTEVMSIIRSLTPYTKVFVVADHGFGIIGRERLRIDLYWVNDSYDCFYLHASLRDKLSDARAPRKVRENVIEFSVEDLRMPASEGVKEYKSIIFPKTGYALARPNAKFSPDAYSHGGISIQEMLIPMLAMRVKGADEGLLVLGSITGPAELIEGEEAEYRMPVQLTESQKHREVRIEAQAVYQNKEETVPIPTQVQYISATGGAVVFRFTPDVTDASDEERRGGIMERSLRISVSYRETDRMVRRARNIKFSVRLNSEKVVRRVPAHLGKILGLTPRSMKG